MVFSAGHDSQSIAAEEQESCEGRQHKQPLTTDQINGTGGTNVFSKSSESVPEESALPHYEHFSMQSKQHRMEGEGQLFQTQDAIHSYKISSQLKKRQRKIHRRICLKNVLKCQEKERAESKVLSQLQCEEEQEREFCHWRLDDKKTNAHCSSEQNKERQDNKEGNQQPCACDMELETLRNALIQLQEGKEEGCTEAVPKAKEMEDEMQKLVLQNFLLKATIEKKTKKIERLQQKLKRQRAKLPSSPLVNLFPKSTTLKRKTSFSIVRSQGHVQKGSENLIENQIECRLKMFLN
ncbi:uncharacterized protein RHO17_004904 isoform 1-T1 [Thomomys bottae]